jgi:Coenzyme PQQ synthesis protein D (PqqD)
LGHNPPSIESFVPAPHVLHQEIEGETVLLNSADGLYYALDAVGTRVWQLLAEEGEPGAVKARMLVEFEVDEATLSVDLHDLLERLRAAGLVTARNRS